jgi:hypothetical protein
VFSFRYDPPVSRETVARWQAQLDELFPPADRLSRLLVRWESGDSWQPIQRFTIWQGEDPQTIELPPIVRDALARPHPRSKGHYCASGKDTRGQVWCMCPMKANRWRGGANPHIDRGTWEFYRDTGLFGRRWWTIQGHKGGHRFQWNPSEFEARFSEMNGGPRQTPAPGDLPYAPFDGRVLERIAPLDKVRAWSKMVDFATRHPDQLDAEEEQEATAFKEALFKHIDWGIEEAWEIGGGALKQHLRETVGRKKVGSQDDVDYEAVEEQFMSVAF